MRNISNTLQVQLTDVKVQVISACGAVPQQPASAVFSAEQLL